MNKKEIVKKFFKEHFYVLNKEIREKFREVFSSYLDSSHDALEDMQTLFWTEIVEPGWQPQALKDFYVIAEGWENNSDEEIEAYNLIGEYFITIEKIVCIRLGLPVETIEL